MHNNTIVLQSLPSTNDYLRDELAKSKPFPEGTVIMAVDQFAGKGQKGSGWLSAPGQNLTFSMLLKPVFILPKDQFCLTMAVSLALTDFFEVLLPAERKVQIKWPNDIYVDGRKITGILIENLMQGKKWKYAITGIGINVNQTDFPEEFRDRVTSLRLLTGREADPQSLLPALRAAIENRYRSLRASSPAEASSGSKDDPHRTLLDTYTGKLYRFGEKAGYLIDGVLVPGRICGVSPSGRLLIDFDGHVVDFDIKEIAFTPPDQS